MHRGLGRLHWIELVVNGRRRTCQIENLVHLHVQRKCHVVSHVLEMRMTQKLDDISLRPGVEVIHTKDLCPFVQQAPTQMRSDESGAARNKNTLHNFPPNTCRHQAIPTLYMAPMCRRDIGRCE